MNFIDEILLQYSDWLGQPFLRKELATFLTHYCRAPTPLYSENVGGSKWLLVSLFLTGHGCVTQVAKKVKGLVLINPQNPLGDVYTRSMLKEYLTFAGKNNLHVIIDESYMLSVFNASITFHSVLSMKQTHMIWDTSKDFGISVFHFGVLYTHNKKVASAMGAFGYLHGVPGIAQYKLCKCSMTKYLSPCTFDQEQILYQCFLDKKLVLSKGGSYMCKEPGWFCLLFAVNRHQLKVAMDQFCMVLKEYKRDTRRKELEQAIRT